MNNVIRVDFKNGRTFGDLKSAKEAQPTDQDEQEIEKPEDILDATESNNPENIEVLLAAFPVDLWNEIMRDIEFYSGNPANNRQPGFDHGKRAQSLMFKIASSVYAKQAIPVVTKD